MSGIIADFTPVEIEHTARSGRTFKLRELNARQQLWADSLSDKMAASMYNRLAMSLVSIDDSAFPVATSDLAITARLQSLRGSEADELVMVYVRAFSPRGEELKNESAPAD